MVNWVIYFISLGSVTIFLCASALRELQCDFAAMQVHRTRGCVLWYLEPTVLQHRNSCKLNPEWCNYGLCTRIYTSGVAYYTNVVLNIIQSNGK
jgi:hypothetical protein